MKKFKKGFSLAELLIALAIISIIAIMGLNITKKSAENAYNLYIYSGYSAIQSAIADASCRGYKADDCAEGSLSGDNTCTFIKHIKKLLVATDIENPNINILKKYIAKIL